MVISSCAATFVVSHETMLDVTYCCTAGACLLSLPCVGLFVSSLGSRDVGAVGRAAGSCWEKYSNNVVAPPRTRTYILNDVLNDVSN